MDKETTALTKQSKDIGNYLVFNILFIKIEDKIFLT